MTYETDEDKELYEKKRCSFNGSVDAVSYTHLDVYKRQQQQ